MFIYTSQVEYVGNSRIHYGNGGRRERKRE
jgi:hypothetical protein